MRNKYICDVCMTEIIEQGRWELNAEALDLIVYVSSQNPLSRITGEYQTAHLSYKEVCDPCRKAVAEAIALAIFDRRGMNK